MWDRIFSEWFPSTRYEHAEAPELEAYPASGDIHASDHRTEIWIPVVKK
ncbi:GyrI-like domain-containing protein [Bacillus atrophaeus]